MTESVKQLLSSLEWSVKYHDDKIQTTVRDIQKMESQQNPNKSVLQSLTWSLDYHRKNYNIEFEKLTFLNSKIYESDFLSQIKKEIIFYKNQSNIIKQDKPEVYKVYLAQILTLETILHSIEKEVPLKDLRKSYIIK